MIHSFESYSTESTLIIVDVQKSFKNFFTNNYVSALKSHCSKFGSVYQIYDNHYMGKNVDKRYLYSSTQRINRSDLYQIPNIKDYIEKRYVHGVSIDFFKSILDKETLVRAKKSTIGIGDSVRTKYGTNIFFTGNKHRWFHCPRKLEQVLKKLSGSSCEIVGGSDKECLDDIFVTAESFGVKIKKNYKYIWSAKNCPIK